MSRCAPFSPCQAAPPPLEGSGSGLLGLSDQQRWLSDPPCLVASEDNGRIHPRVCQIHSSSHHGRAIIDTRLRILLFETPLTGIVHGILRITGSTSADFAFNIFPLIQRSSSFFEFQPSSSQIGTAISVCSISLLAIQRPEDMTLQALTALAQALVSALCMNVAIVGLNQMYDVDIDKVNKPYLPLASGEFTMETGQRIVYACAIAGMAVGLVSGSIPLIITLGISWVGFPFPVHAQSASPERSRLCPIYS